MRRKRKKNKKKEEEGDQELQTALIRWNEDMQECKDRIYKQALLDNLHNKRKTTNR